MLGSIFSFRLLLLTAIDGTLIEEDVGLGILLYLLKGAEG
jgi:hypothetical protein